LGSDAGTMRKLPLLLAMLLLSVLLSAASAQASLLPGAPQPLPVLLAEFEEEDEAEEDETGEEDEEAEDPAEDAEIEREICEEDPELCEEETGNGNGKRKADQCLLKKASATVTANPGKSRLRLTVRYTTLKPATVNVEAGLRGSKGVLFLGSEHSRFRRSGVYRDTFQLSEKKMKKALAARDFEVELQAVNTPASCRVELTAKRDGAKKLIWS
jgi:hypothetical protein